MDWLHLSPERTCRVRPNQPSIRTGKSPYEVVRGCGANVTPTGVRYFQGGMTIVDFNEGLRVPQQPDFLFYKMFNPGCYSLTCKDSTQCPDSRPVHLHPRTQLMFKHAFSSSDPFVGNDAPNVCAGPKCNSYNSAVGWEVVGHGDDAHLNWQTKGNDGNCGTPHSDYGQVY